MTEKYLTLSIFFVNDYIKQMPETFVNAQAG
jgi:hypothetical protein